MPGHYEKALKKKLPAAQTSDKKPAPLQAKHSLDRKKAKQRGYDDIAKAHGSERSMTLSGKGKRGTFKRGSGKAFEKRQKELKKQIKQNRKADRKRKVKKLVGKLTGKKY